MALDPMFGAARSVRSGTLDAAEVVALGKPFARDYLGSRMRAISKELDQLAGDVICVEGDLHIHGDLDLHKAGVSVLVVQGDLVVDGVFVDYDEPENLTLVHGSMRADRIVTAGFLEVHGDLVVRDAMIGDYNDCSCYVNGDLTAALFYPEEHHFTVKGAVNVERALGYRSRLDCADPPVFAEVLDKGILDVLSRDLLKVYEDSWEEDGETFSELYVEELDFTELKRRVKSGRPYRADPT